MRLSKKFSGLDFHENALSYATIKLERSIPVLHDVGFIDLNKEIINAGRVTEKDLVSSKIKEVARSGKLKKNIHIAIPTQNILIRNITTLPDVGDPELAKLLQFQVGESIHLPFEEPIYDFVKIGSIQPTKIDRLADEAMDDDELSLDELAKGIEEDIDGPKSEILFFATSKPFAQDLSDVCTSGGLKPLTAEIRALALQRLLLYAQPLWLKETEMIVDVSETSVDIHIFKDSRIVFTRMMSLNRYDYVKPNISSNKEADVLLLEDEWSLSDETESEIAATVEEDNSWNVDSYINDLVLEIERAQNFFRYSLNERDSEFKRIIVTGRNTDQVFDLLKSRMGSEGIVRIDYSSILAPNFSEHHLLDACGVAIGLAFRANDK